MEAATRDRLVVTSGEAAARQLNDPAFVEAWEALAARCPWTTAFQRAAYANAWFRVYGARHVPVIISEQDDQGHLMGLLVLARDRQAVSTAADGALAAVGRHQAEYQGWLCTPEAAPAFPARALAALRQAVPGLRHLRLGYLPPGLSTAWVPAVERAGIGVRQSRHARGLMRVGPGTSIEASLKKSANRSRLSRLQKLGPVALDQLTTREALESVIDEIALHCDLRQGARHGSLPFTDDPDKRAFLLALMDSPGLAHVTVLRAGSTLVAAHLSVTDGRTLPLGIVTHAPLHAACSPGKLLLLLLGKTLGAQGYDALDLTPGGDAYKDRFASDSDEVALVDLWFDRAAERGVAWRQAIHRVVRGRVKQAAARYPVVQRLRHAVRRKIVLYGPVWLPWTLARKLLRHWWAWRALSREFRFYVHPLPPPVAGGLGDVRVNALQDLLHFAGNDPDYLPRQDFLRVALERLERGCLLFTRTERDALLHSAWLDPNGEEIGSDFGHLFAVVDRPAVLWDDYTVPSARGRRFQRESILARLAVAAGTSRASYAVIGCAAGNIPSRRNIEQVGFQYVGSAWHTVRFGRSTRWATWTGPLRPDAATGQLRWHETAAPPASHQSPA